MMNKLVKKAAVVIGAAMMSIMAVTAVSANETKYVANDIGVNVRQSASAKSTRLGGLYQGDAVDVVEDMGNGWAKINFGGKTAYVVSDCLSYSKPAVKPANNTGKTDAYGFLADSNQAVKRTYTVNVAPGTYLTLRNAPSSDASAEIGQLHSGEKVTVIEGSGQFWTVESQSLGRVGYVNSNYLV